MIHRAMKSNYQLRGKRLHRPAKPEFAMTGILVGIVIGWIVGFGLELIYSKHTVLMVGTAIAGLLLGAGFDALRFRWRMHRFRAGDQPKPHQIS
jgi:hypothetical protein